jgi:hypothetical protein
MTFKPCKIWRGKIKMEGPVQAMMSAGRSVTLIPRITNLSTNGGELSTSCPGLFIPEKNLSSDGRFDGLHSRLDASKKI